MKVKSTLIFSLFVSTILFGQNIDTLSFHSNAFNATRTVIVHKPKFFKYKSDSVKFPVIYILDGQHEWFINPLLSDIEYLQYTHEIPNTIVVVIPHKDRYVECGITDLETPLPLDKFITEELDEQLEQYHPNNFKLIIGHSFSASFALYSFYNSPKYYSAVISNTPLNRIEMLVEEFEKESRIDKNKISIAIGGIAGDKDYHHRQKYNELKTSFPSFFNVINTFEADNSAHNAVPIVATPSLLTKVFAGFRSRYSEIAMVDLDYKLKSKPNSIDVELQKIQTASQIGNYYYPPEIPDLNGIASRYSYSGFNDYATMVYELGIQYYPKNFEFYLSLYELLLGEERERAKVYLYQAELLLNTIDSDLTEKDEIIKEIEAEKAKWGWQ